MAEEAQSDTIGQTADGRRSFWRRRVILPLLLIFTLAFVAFWLQRHRLAENVIGSYLRSHHVQATYRIDHIGGRREVLSNIVVGDPKRPDLTVERAEVIIRYRFGLPGIARIVLVKPRLRGTYKGGKLSFGALDPLLFAPEQQRKPFEWPEYSLDLVDGRAVLQTDYGPVGIRAHGRGSLRDGFRGMLAAGAPRLAVAGCDFAETLLYGQIGVEARRPTFRGPLQFRSLDCGEGSPRLASTTLGIDLRLDRDLAGGEGKAVGAARAARYANAAAEGLHLAAGGSYRRDVLVANYKLTADGVMHPEARLAHFSANGTVRAGKAFDRLRIESDFAGSGLRPGDGFDRSLVQLADSARGTLLGAVLHKLQGALLREAGRSAFVGQATLSKAGRAVSLVVPQASLTGGSGERVLSLSRFQYGGAGSALPRLSGNFSTGGRDLPRIEGRIEQDGNEGFTAQLAMATYEAQGGSIAVPSLAIVSRGRGLGFAGRAILSGDLPGGHAERLLLPISGNWSSAAGLALWRGCTPVSFDSLRFASLTLERRGFTVCPAKGVPIVRYGPAGLDIAAGVPSLDLAGRLGSTPIAIRSGPVGFGYPGTLAARRLLVTLGPAATATTFAVNDLTAHIGKTIAGRFGGADAKLFRVPMDIRGAQGTWDYTAGRFTIGDGSFRLVDREKERRFEPLVSRGATLALADNVITARAVLREPTTDREVTQVDLRHDLASGRGHADLKVPGLLFDEKLQPGLNCSAPAGSRTAGLSCLAFGVVANVRGTVSGTGRVDWDEKGITSSGRFSSDALDFAASFGPVKGASGTVAFTDLLGLTTAPNQVIKVASVNPGIEVTEGEISFELKGGKGLTVNRGTWPFMGGTLTMRPVTLNLGTSEERAYVLEIRGLEAAKFVERMQLENMNATGVFDGEIPLVFDVAGNGRIQGGHLASRGGGNVSYVGDLTYKDLSTMANMAFDALRSLNYQRMTIDMNGPLTGEIVTRVRFDGVSQGVGAKRNFITREIGKLPFRFVVTVTAPFYKLITNIRSMYDPTMIQNPQELASQGKLLDANGNPVAPGSLPPFAPPPAKPTSDEANIQRRESENKR